MQIIRTFLSLILYLFIGTEIFINLPINLNLDLGKEDILNYGGLLSILSAVAMSYFFPFSFKAFFIISFIYVIYVYTFLENKSLSIL